MIPLLTTFVLLGINGNIDSDLKMGMEYRKVCIMLVLCSYILNEGNVETLTSVSDYCFV